MTTQRGQQSAYRGYQAGQPAYREQQPVYRYQAGQPAYREQQPVYRYQAGQLTYRGQQTVQRGTQATQRNYHTEQDVTYMYGSTAKKLAPMPQKKHYHEPQVRERKQAQTRIEPVNMPLLILSIVAFVALGVMMIQYIRLNSEITAITTANTKLESQISDLKMSNDDYYSRIMNSVDLEKVREVAIMDLDMVYASEEQIITYDAQVDDYVEQSRVVQD